MTTDVYHITIDRAAKVNEAEQTLHLAIFAAEGLFGAAQVRMDMAYHVDEPRQTLIIDGSTTVGRAVLRMFIALLLHEIGRDAFTIRRVPQINLAPLGKAA
ncbi:MAG: hypothetical protein GF331_13495 [Chitinivibrionales bacterium]|nr:hypothetical protein [Chitinivibrionales bacterium]